MNGLYDLITASCPRGVEFKTLDEIGRLYNGLTGKSKADFADGNARFVTYMNVFKNTATSVLPDDTVQVGDGERQNRVRYGDVLFTASSESAEEVGMASAVAAEPPEPLYLNSFCFGFRPSESVELDPEFAKHLFRSREVRRQIIATAHGVTRINISKKRFRTIRIPVPPMEVQREIAGLLDRMERLKVELEAELEARRWQYEHYRDSLLALAEGDGGRLVTFGEVATIVRGGSPRPIQAYLTDAADGVNWIKIGDVASGGKYITSTSEKIKPEGALRSRRVEPGDFVLSNSMSFGRPYIVKIDGCIHDGWLAIKDFGRTFLPDFLYHLLRTTRVYKEMAQRAGAGTVQNLNAEIVKRLVLPVPPLAEQERIVAILDKFDTLVNDLSIGLPAELHARRQQYEHYRDRLLTFSEAE